jgi:hypothetical protein
MIARGELNVVHLGRAVRVPVSAVEELVESLLGQTAGTQAGRFVEVGRTYVSRRDTNDQVVTNPLGGSMPGHHTRSLLRPIPSRILSEELGNIEDLDGVVRVPGLDRWSRGA